MWRASTPTLAFKFPFAVTDIDDLHFDIKQNGVSKLSKDLDDFSTSGTNIIYILLTQTETKALAGDQYCCMQFMIRFNNGHVVPSSMMILPVQDVLNDTVFSGTATAVEPSMAIDVSFPQIDGSMSVVMGMGVVGSMSVAWTDITGKPETFPPSVHTHTKGQITDFPSALSSFTDDLGSSPTHTHSQYLTSIDWTEILNKPSTFPPSTHNHNSLYYTKEESDGKYITEHQSLSAYRTASAQDVIDNAKASASDLTTHTSDGNIHVTASKKAEWDAKAETSDIPTKTTDLTNDSGFITNTVNDLTNYYLKTGTYSKEEVNSLIGAVKQFTYELVSELPTASSSTMNKIYLVPSSQSAQSNIKDEFITLDNGSSASPLYTWEQIGSTSIDLSNYYTKSQTDSAISGHHDSTKQDVISDLSSIRSGASAGSTAVQPSAISDMATKTWVGGQGYLTQHQSLSGYATQTWVNQQGFLTSVDWTAILNKPQTFAPSAHTHTVSDISNFPTIPSKTSQLTNDSGFLTSHQSLSAYRTSSAQDVIDATLQPKSDNTLSTTSKSVVGAINEHESDISQLNEDLADKIDKNMTATATGLAAGASPTVSYNSSTNVMAFGIPKGDTGQNGTNGQDGDDGQSAYEIYVSHGGTLTEAQWLASLAATPPPYAATTAEMTDTSKVYVGSNGHLWACAERQKKYLHWNAYKCNYTVGQEEGWVESAGYSTTDRLYFDSTNRSDYLIEFKQDIVFVNGETTITAYIVYFNSNNIVTENLPFTSANTDDISFLQNTKIRIPYRADALYCRVRISRPYPAENNYDEVISLGKIINGTDILIGYKTSYTIGSSYNPVSDAEYCISKLIDVSENENYNLYGFNTLGWMLKILYYTNNVVSSVISYSPSPENYNSFKCAFTIPTGVDKMVIRIYGANNQRTCQNMTYLENSMPSSSWNDTGVVYSNYSLTTNDKETIAQKVLDYLDVTSINLDNILTIGSYELDYGDNGTSSLGEVNNQ